MKELMISYAGYDSEMDSRITKAVGRQDIASGFGFGQRDLIYSFVKNTALEAAIKRVKKLRIRGLLIQVTEVPPYEELYDD